MKVRLPVEKRGVLRWRNVSGMYFSDRTTLGAKYNVRDSKLVLSMYTYKYGVRECWQAWCADGQPSAVSVTCDIWEWGLRRCHADQAKSRRTSPQSRGPVGAGGAGSGLGSGSGSGSGSGIGARSVQRDGVARPHQRAAGSRAVTERWRDGGRRRPSSTQLLGPPPAAHLLTVHAHCQTHQQEYHQHLFQIGEIGIMYSNSSSSPIYKQTK